MRLDLYLGDFSGLGSVCPIDRAAGTAEPEPTGSVYQSKAMPAELHGPKSDVGTNKPLTHDLHEIMSLLITLIINKQRMPNIY